MPIDHQEKITIIHDSFIELCLEKIHKHTLRNAGLDFPITTNNLQKGIEIAYHIPLLGNVIKLFHACDQICQLTKEIEFSEIIRQVFSSIGEKEIISHLSELNLKVISFYRNYISHAQDKQTSFNLAVNLYNKFFENLLVHKNFLSTIDYLNENLHLIMPEAISEDHESSNSHNKRAKFDHFNFDLKKEDIKSKFFNNNGANSLNGDSSVDEEIYFLNLPHKRKYFIGRREELSLIEDLFQEAENKLLIISGPGGIGKDAIAQEFAHSNLIKYNQRVRIILASNKNEIELSYREFAEELKLDIAKLTNAQIIKLVKKTLATKVLTSLIIFENVEYFDLIKEYLPESNAKFSHHVIITTQNDKNFRDFSILYDSTLIKLNPFSDEEAVNYISQFLGSTSENKESMVKLANLFMNIPLCISHSLAYIKINRINIEAYLTLYQNFREKEPLALPHNLQVSSYDIHRDNFFNTISMCISQLKNRKPILVDILAIIALLNPDNIPVEFFNSFFTTEEEKNEIIFTLDGYCFVSLSEDKKTMKIHSFIQEIVRVCLTKDSDDPVKQALKIVHDNSKREHMFNAHYNKSKIILNQVLSIIKHYEIRYSANQLLKKYAAAIYNDCGNLYFITGKFPEAIKQYFFSINLYETYEKNYDKKINKIRINLATTYFMLRKFEESTNQIDQALAFYAANSEMEESLKKTCQLLLKKGNNFIHLNLHSHAIATLEQALSHAKASEDNQLIADISFNLGICHKELNNHDISNEYFINSFEINKKIFSSNVKPNSYASITLANILKSMQNYDEALSMLQIDIYNKNSPQVDIKTAISFCFVASILRNLDRDQESLQNYLKALEILEQLFDQNYYLVGEIQITIANTYFNLEQYVEAEKFYFQALKLFPENSRQHNIIKDSLLLISEAAQEGKGIRAKITNLSRQESYSYYVSQVIRLIETLEYIENSQSQNLNLVSQSFISDQASDNNQAVEYLMQTGKFVFIWHLLKANGKENNIFDLSKEQIDSLLILIEKPEINQEELEEILSFKNSITSPNDQLNDNIEKFTMILAPEDLASNPGFHQHILASLRDNSLSKQIIEIIIHYYQKLESTFFSYNFFRNDHTDSIELQLIELIEFARSGVSMIIPYRPYFFEPHDEPGGAGNGNDGNHNKNSTSSEEPILASLTFYGNNTNHDI